MRAAGALPQIFENHLEFVNNIICDFKRQNSIEHPIPTSAYWQVIRITVPIPDEDSHQFEEERFLAELFLERLLISGDFLSKKDPQVAFCCHFLVEIGADAVWNVFKNLEHNFYNFDNFFGFVRVVYNQEHRRSASAVRSALQRTAPGEEIDFTQDFREILQLHSKIHDWKWD